jgi:hypothetical protein
MTTGSWVPETAKASLILPSEVALARWATLSDEQISQLAAADINLLSSTVNAGVDRWIEHLDACNQDTLLGLLKFFTLAEMNHAPLRADKHNPAIACAKLLRKRHGALDKALLQWIRSVSDNRFLPYGPL